MWRWRQVNGKKFFTIPLFWPTLAILIFFCRLVTDEPTFFFLVTSN